MKRAIASTVLFPMACAMFGQTNPARPQFEAAVIKLYKAGAADESGHVFPGGQLSLGNVTMTGLLRFAYFVRENAIAGSPAWFRSDRFDVIAKAPPHTPIATLRLMMQSLLASEFRLAVRQEQKTQDAFVLVVAKGGPKLKKAAGSIPPGCERSAPNGQQRHVDCYNMSMADFAERLPNEASIDIDRMVVDRTGIAGTYDMKLDWVGDAQIANDGPTIFEALTAQLGLRLEPRKISLPALVIDHAERLTEH